MTLRTNRTERAYQVARAEGRLLPLAQEQSLLNSPTFSYWKIVSNRFPHDRHHERHDLVVLLRDCPPKELTPSELSELWRKVVPWADTNYDYLKFNFTGLRSVNHTPHLHLLTLKDEYRN